MIIKIGKHQLNAVKKPEIYFDRENGIMAIILTVEKDDDFKKVLADYTYPVIMKVQKEKIINKKEC